MERRGLVRDVLMGEKRGRAVIGAFLLFSPFSISVAVFLILRIIVIEVVVFVIDVAVVAVTIMVLSSLTLSLE